MRRPWFRRTRTAREPPLSIGDPRLDSWETVSTFEDLGTALAWRDQLRQLGVSASLTADHALDQLGRGDIYLVVAPHDWERASEVLDNLE